jgi:hypothetical protein
VRNEAHHSLVDTCKPNSDGKESDGRFEAGRVTRLLVDKEKEGCIVGQVSKRVVQLGARKSYECVREAIFYTAGWNKTERA